MPERWSGLKRLESGTKRRVGKESVDSKEGGRGNGFQMARRSYSETKRKIKRSVRRGPE